MEGHHSLPLGDLSLIHKTGRENPKERANRKRAELAGHQFQMSSVANTTSCQMGTPFVLGSIVQPVAATNQCSLEEDVLVATTSALSLSAACLILCKIMVSRTDAKQGKWLSNRGRVLVSINLL